MTYRVNKNLDTLFFVTHRAVKELLEKAVTKSYNSAHTLKRDPSLRDKKLYKILEQPWSGANYSANIWNNRDKLAGIAQNEITKGIYQGKSAKKISKNISERLDVSMKDIERVVRTESKHARNEASAQAYIDMGYEWYMFSSHTEGKSSERTCERCRKINEEKYRFDKRVVGENFPPLHPNCRCTIIPIMNDDENNKNIINLKESGAVYYVRNTENDFVLDKDFVRKDKHAYNQFNAIKNRNREKEVEDVYKNIRKIPEMEDFSKEDVSIVYKHVFDNKYELEGGFKNFDPDYDMAQSFQRLKEGKNIQKHDLTMLRHERMEYDYMNKNNMLYNEAHKNTELWYNYTKDLAEFLEKGRK